jgi:hypothetical protein
VQFNESVITEDEAAIIRKRRLEKMKRIMEEQGYKIEAPEDADGEEEE